MRGCIVVIENKPCAMNDVLDVTGHNSEYPVYGVVRDYDPADDNAAVLCHVVDSEGLYVCDGWWFREDEVQIIEEAPAIPRRRFNPELYVAPAFFVQQGDEVAF